MVASAPLSRCAATTAARSTSKRMSPFQRTMASAPASRRRASRSAPPVPAMTGSREMASSTPAALPRSRPPPAPCPRARWWTFTTTRRAPAARSRARAYADERQAGDRHGGLGQEVGERPEPRAQPGGEDHPDDAVHGRASLPDVPGHATSPLLLRLLRLRRDHPPLLRALPARAGVLGGADRHRPDDRAARGRAHAPSPGPPPPTGSGPRRGCSARHRLGLPRRALPPRGPHPRRGGAGAARLLAGRPRRRPPASTRSRSSGRSTTRSRPTPASGSSARWASPCSRASVGLLLTWRGDRPGDPFVPVAVAACVGAYALVARRLPAPPAPPHPPRFREMAGLLRDGPLLALLARLRASLGGHLAVPPPLRPLRARPRAPRRRHRAWP